MSEWNDYNYVLIEIKKNALSAYNNASKDLQNDKQIFLETIKYIYYQNKGQTDESLISIPDNLKLDEKTCKLYSYYMYSMLDHFKYYPNNPNYNIIKMIVNNLTELDNYCITNAQTIHTKGQNNVDFIYIFKSLIFSQRKIKDELDYNNILLKNNYNKLISENNELKDEINELNDNLIKLKYENDLTGQKGLDAFQAINNNLNKLKCENNKFKDKINELNNNLNEFKIYFTKFKYEINDFQNEFNFNKIKLNLLIIILFIVFIIFYYIDLYNILF
jgi:hypothetical protein